MGQNYLQILVEGATLLLSCCSIIILLEQTILHNKYALLATSVFVSNKLLAIA